MIEEWRIVLHNKICHGFSTESLIALRDALKAGKVCKGQTYDVEAGLCCPIALLVNDGNETADIKEKHQCVWDFMTKVHRFVKWFDETEGSEKLLLDEVELILKNDRGVEFAY